MASTTARPVQPEDLLAIKSIADVQLSPDGRTVAYVVTSIDAEEDEYRSTIWLVSADGGEPVQFTRGQKRDTSPRWSPDGRTLAFLSDRDGEKPQLYVIPVAGGEPRKLTSLDLGAAPPAWSPDGTRLLLSARVSTDTPPTDEKARKRWEQRPRHITRAHYKDDGSGYTFNARTHLFVVPAAGGEAIQITDGDFNDRTPVWSPDGNRIAFVRTRSGVGDFNISDLWVVNAVGGNEQRLTEHVGRATAPSWSPDGSSVACYGADEQTSWMGGEMTRVWTVPTDGGTPDNLTLAYDRSPFVSPLGPPAGPVWSPDGSSLTFLAADAGNVHVVRAAAGDGSVRTVVTGERQIAIVSAAPAARRLAYLASDAITPADIFVCDWDGANERRLTNLNEDLLAGLTMPEVERRQFNSPNGGTIDGWLVRPVTGSGPAPLLVQIHGGPHGFVGNVFRGGAMYEYVLASRGWAVLSLNPSGSGSYGKDFMQTLRGRWGEFDLPEQHAAIDALVSEGIVDPDRLAVTGYSYGGYMTSWVVGHTDRFKAAIIGAPVTNLESFHGTADIGMWFGPGEMLGDIYSARENFRRLSPVNYVNQVTTPTLILHGEADDRCPIGQGEEFFVGLVAAGNVPTEFVRYPGGSHLFLGSGRPSHRVDYSTRVVNWVERFVPAAKPREMVGATGDD